MDKYRVWHTEKKILESFKNIMDYEENDYEDKTRETIYITTVD